MSDPRSPVERVAERSVPADDGSGCIRWQGAHNPGGYGQISVHSRNRPVHVVAYEAAIGPVPDGYEVDHVKARGCRHRDCVNPEHLEAVTGEENRARIGPRTHCRNGHEYTPENTTRARLHGREYRRCRTCNNAQQRAHRARRRARLKAER